MSIRTRPKAPSAAFSAAFLAAAPGSCGELVQGVLDGVSFHISCPVSVFSVARAGHGDGDGVPGLASLQTPGGGGDGELDVLGTPWWSNRVSPSDNRVSRSHDTVSAIGQGGLGEKARAAVERALRRIGHRRPLALDCASDLKPGIGMASSTADIAAVVTAARMAAGVSTSDAETAAVATAVEPSDGTIFSGIVAFDHKRGRHIRRLGPAPDLAITYVDTGGTVDTVDFNREKIRYNRFQENAIRTAYEMAAAGLRYGDRALIGAAATLSARVNQAVLPKPGLEELIETAAECGGYGVVVAHSGTVMGVLHDPAADWIADRISLLGCGPAETVRLINGGCRAWTL